MKGSDAEVIPPVMYFFTVLNLFITCVLLTPYGAYAGDILLKIQFGLIPFCGLLLFFTWKVGAQRNFVAGLTILFLAIAADVLWIVLMWSHFPAGPNFL